MSKSGPFFEQLESVFGKGRVTSGYRSQEEQDALVAQGATKATKSSHTYENGYDLAIPAGRSEAEIRAKAAAAGLPVSKIIRESGKGPNQGTGAHWHVELGNGTVANNGNTTQSRGGPQNPADFLAGLQSNLAPESKASGSVGSEAGAIFGSDKALSDRADSVENTLQKQGQTIDVLTSAQDVLHQVQTAAATQQVEESKSINNEIVAGTEQLKKQVTPVFQARARIADQLDKINTMNPLERGIKGIFDLNYDRDYLENQLSHYDTTLQARASDFDYLNKLHETGLKAIEQRYALDTALPNLHVAQVTEDLGTLGLSLQQTSGMLGNLKDRVSTQSSLIAAKAQARNDLIGRLDAPTILDLANQAKAHGGVVTYNGVDMDYHSLREEVQNREQKELNMEATRMSIQGGRMDIADKYANNVVNYMSRADLEGAIANGGMYNGIQLPTDSLTQALKMKMDQGTLMAQNTLTNMPATQVLQQATQAFNSMTALTRRTAGILGNAQIPGVAEIAHGSSDLIQKLVVATKDGSPPEVIQALLGQIGEKQAALAKTVDQNLLRHVGGDPKAAGYLKSFVYGTPMSPGSASEAIAYFAMKGALPEGMGLSAESKQIFARAQQVVAANRINPSSKKARTPAELQQIVTSTLAAEAPGILGNARSNRIIADLPSVAARVGHPFGKIDPTAYKQAQIASSGEAARVMATKLGTTDDVVLKMAQNAKPIDNTPEGKALYESFKSQADVFNSLEQGALIHNLDDMPQVTTGRRNSSVLIDFMHSPQMQGAVGAYTQAQGDHAMGDYFANPIANGATESTLGRYVTDFSAIQERQTASARANARAQAASMAYNPSVRIGIILKSIPGISAQGEKALQPTIKTILQSFKPEQTVDMLGGGENPLMVQQETYVHNQLASMKFDDPNLETYRKLALRGWAQSATQQKTFMENTLSTINDAFHFRP